MKTVKLSKNGQIKAKRMQFLLDEKDCQELSRSFLPGEWAQFWNEAQNLFYFGFINQGVAQGRPIIHLMAGPLPSYGSEEDEFERGWEWVRIFLERAKSRREMFKSCRECGRWVYGMGDNLPGLVVDKYENCVLIQINSAGLDRYRRKIADWFQGHYPDTKIFLYDDKELRKVEGLPVYEEKITVETIVLKENNFILDIPASRIQKAGYYFDHRNNRQKLETLLGEIQMKKERGLDLFCYVGTWGLHLLRAGVAEVTFVDQGDFAEVIQRQMEKNPMKGKGNFIRQDIFKFLDEKISQGETFDVVASDPPAFAKSARDKQSALGGYLKLHQKLMKVMGERGILAVNSCTKYVSFDDLDRTVSEAATKEGKRVRLLDLGLQGYDHPMESLRDPGHYLKCLLYYVESRPGGAYE